jgi:hypothetical protein
MPMLRPRRMDLLQRLWQALAVIVLASVAWFTVHLLRDCYRYKAWRDYQRTCIEAAIVVQDLIYGTNSTMLDGRSREFNADLASILEGQPGVERERPQPGDRRSWVRFVITNGQGQALRLLLQGEYASGGWRFRVLSYRKIAQAVAPPNGGPTMPVGDSGASEGRHR